MELSAGLVVGDRFRLERELGRGGMGAVWLARHLGLDVPCAIKFILAQAAESPELRARFEREAKAAAHIKGANVVQILDYGIWQNVPYIAMEYLEGEDLGRRLARRGKLDARETAALVSQVARALGKAHAMGIVHRDIKPSNIFLCSDPDGEVAKVVDFGIAKSRSLVIGEGQTRTGALIGTPSYMSPEQVQGNKTVDHRADLWALGVVVFQCLTGRLPFESDGFGDLVLLIMASPPPVPSRIADVPPGFDAWWARAAEHDPAKRFQSAREMAEALYLALGISVGTAGELRDSTPSGLTAPALSQTPSTPPATPSTPPGAIVAPKVTPSTPPGAIVAPKATPSTPPGAPSPTPMGAVLPAWVSTKRGRSALAVVGATVTLLAAAGVLLLGYLILRPARTAAPGSEDTTTSLAAQVTPASTVPASGTGEAPATLPEAGAETGETRTETAETTESASASSATATTTGGPGAGGKVKKPKPKPSSSYVND